jgi:membrane protease YdiL (CAAX protease family)
VLHAFNTVDYFSGRLTFAGTLAAATTVTALLFGLLRELTGSIAPGIIVHFLNNILWFTLLPAVTRRLLSAP